MARYFGGKNHLYQAIINLIPQHARFVELFGGSAAVSRFLARGAADATIVELDPTQVAWLRERKELAGHRILGGDAFEVLEMLLGAAPEQALRARAGAAAAGDVVLFADPPYPIADRRDARPRYRCELTLAQHERLIELLRRAADYGMRVLVCGHPWGLYPSAFADWTRHEFATGLRSGRRGIECVWTSYPDPYPLHDYRYYGADKGARQDLRRRVERQLALFGAMDRHHRAAILRALVTTFGRP
jgi:16S rRNA G966 N2-methylase RsmD